MKRLIRPLALASIAGALVFGTTKAMAQGQFDPAEFRQRMLEQYQERLGLSGDEWKAVQPLLETVMTKQQAANTGRGGFGAFGGGRRGGGDAAGGGGQGRRGGFGGPPSPEIEALNAAIESGNASDIKAKMEAVRASRKKAQAELQDAREKLRKVLTAKQEAQLFVTGILD